MTAPISKAWFEDYEVAMALPSVDLGPMDRYDYIPIALILRDTNPLHLDRVYAQERGLPDVVQQGPLNQAYLSVISPPCYTIPGICWRPRCALLPTCSPMTL